MSTSRLGRRPFLAGSAVALAGTCQAVHAQSPQRPLNFAVVGTGGRGTSLGSSFGRLAEVTVSAACDVDLRRAKAAANTIGRTTGKSVRAEQDFRRLLTDDGIDGLIVATSNHWHAPAALMGLAAGKHVYVEKPCSHNPREGEWLVEAAARHDRRVQHGTQRRSRPGIQQGIARIHAGAIGRPYHAQCFYRNVRPSIGQGKQGDPPADLDFDLWQGPAPRRPFQDNILHYNWHWFWHWGNGELGNNGVHFVDIARAALDVQLPSQVNSSGGRFRWPEDDQESPDTQLANFLFPGGSQITWEALSCNRNRPGETGDEIWVYGEEGCAAFTSNGFRLYDGQRKLIEQHQDRGGEQDHLENFIAAIRGERALNAPIDVGHQSALLCHLGNISQRTGRTLHCDPTSGQILDDPAAMRYWQREYEPGWEPAV